MTENTQTGPILSQLLDQAVKLFWQSPVNQVTGADGTIKSIAVDDTEAARITVLNFMLHRDGKMDALAMEVEALELDGVMLDAWLYAFSILAKTVTWLIKQLEQYPELQNQSWFRYANRENPDWLANPTPPSQPGPVTG